MHTYLIIIYQQWCCELDYETMMDGEKFIKHVHQMVGYNETELRRFLVHQEWFVSKINKELL